MGREGYVLLRHIFFTFEEGKSDPKSRVTEKGFCDYTYITIEEKIVITIVCTLQLPFCSLRQNTKNNFHHNHS